MSVDLDSFKEKIKENQEKIKLNKQLPYLFGNIVEITREMMISPRNSRLAFATLTKTIGRAVKPDSTEEEVIKYKWHDPNVIPIDMTLEVSELFTRELTRDWRIRNGLEEQSKGCCYAAVLLCYRCTVLLDCCCGIFFLSSFIGSVAAPL